MTVASTDQVAAAAGPAPAQPIRKDAGDKRAILLLAVAIVMPLSFVVSPRWLHKINVFLIRLTSFHILLIIHFCELNAFGQGISLTAEKGKSLLSRLPIFNSGLDSASSDVIEAAFDYQVPQDADEWQVQDDPSGDEADAEADREDGDAPKQGKSQDRNGKLGAEDDGCWEEQAAAKLERNLSGQPQPFNEQPVSAASEAHAKDASAGEPDGHRRRRSSRQQSHVRRGGG